MLSTNKLQLTFGCVYIFSFNPILHLEDFAIAFVDLQLFMHTFTVESNTQGDSRLVRSS